MFAANPSECTLLNPFRIIQNLSNRQFTRFHGFETFEAYENRSVAFSFVETKFSVCKIISGNALCCLNKLTVSVQQCFVAI